MAASDEPSQRVCFSGDAEKSLHYLNAHFTLSGSEFNRVGAARLKRRR